MKLPKMTDQEMWACIRAYSHDPIKHAIISHGRVHIKLRKNYG